MNKLNYIIFLLYFFSVNAVANFSGIWQGFGKITINNQTNACPQFQVQFEQTANDIKTSGSVLKCKGINIIGKENTLKIEDGRLFFEDTDIGQITNSKIETSYIDKVNGFKYEYKLQILDPSVIDYVETVKTKNNVLFYQVHAYLKLNLNLFE
jgi:hypothetical protein